MLKRSRTVSPQICRMLMQILQQRVKCFSSSSISTLSEWPRFKSLEQASIPRLLKDFNPSSSLWSTKKRCLLSVWWMQILIESQSLRYKFLPKLTKMITNSKKTMFTCKRLAWFGHLRYWRLDSVSLWPIGPLPTVKYMCAISSKISWQKTRLMNY